MDRLRHARPPQVPSRRSMGSRMYLPLPRVSRSLNLGPFLEEFSTNVDLL
jgi:hypothetical protein